MSDGLTTERGTGDSCECGSTIGPFAIGSGLTLICSTCAADESDYGPCKNIDAQVYTICRDATCANCYPDPCPACRAPDGEGCICVPDIPHATLKAVLADLGVSLNSDGSVA